MGVEVRLSWVWKWGWAGDVCGIKKGLSWGWSWGKVWSWGQGGIRSGWQWGWVGEDFGVGRGDGCPTHQGWAGYTSLTHTRPLSGWWSACPVDSSWFYWSSLGAHSLFPPPPALRSLRKMYICHPRGSPGPNQPLTLLVLRSPTPRADPCQATTLVWVQLCLF